jgi:tetratricopeptide (TPR) repeat protein
LLGGWGAYHAPPIQRRLSWRIDFAMTYLRGVINPVSPLPTALPQPHIAITRQPTQPPTQAAPAKTSVQFSPTPVPPTPTPLPAAIQLTAPKWEKQDINNCGPAALSMYLHYYNWQGDQTEIASLIKPQREDRNVNIDELAFYVHTRAGWLNAEYRVGGTLARLKSLLAAGFPVIIEESFYFETPYWPKDDLWGAHYQLLTGYDEAAGTFTGQDSYYGANQAIPYAKLDQYWQAFNRVYFMVYLPAQESSLQALLGSDWDVDANRQAALATAQAETKAQPQNAFAWFNLGSNLVYFEKYPEAVQAYDQARQIGLPQRMLRYQFGPFLAYFHADQIDELMTLTQYALQRTPNAEEALLWHGWALYRQGKGGDAVADFQKALQMNPNYKDAQYALQFVGANPQ